ncbi:MAG TPA: phosphatase PAP2 family protein [Candidatus Saccharimonadia bacterium]
MNMLDVSLLELVHSVSNPTLDRLAVFLTQLGGAIFITALVSVTAAGLLWQRRRQAATLLVVTIGGAGMLNIMLKLLFQRDRPTLWEALAIEHTYSFPSGHAMASSALAFALIILVWHTKWRLVALLCGAFYITIIGLTRMYLGVHFPSDIIAGWIVSLGWTYLVYRAVYGLKPHKP